MTGLLISVRNAAEAEIALTGGAVLIDVKEPAHGALGRADDAVISAVVAAVAGRRPVSAALGEMDAAAVLPACAGLSFVKSGLAGWAGRPWQATLASRFERTAPQTVVVAYADWQCAAAPPVQDIVAFACARPGNVLLVDTHCKDPALLSLRRRPTLLDWLTVADVLDICSQCRDAGVRIALAGSLGFAEIETLLSARPDWFAVRGAVCASKERAGTVQLAKVLALARMINSAAARCAG